MNNKTILLLTCICIALFALWHYKTKNSHVRSFQDVILVGTNAEFPPFTFIDEKGDIVGFDIDIAHHVVDELGKKMEIKDRSFDMLIPEAQSGAIHIIAAGMTPTYERAQHVLFTKPYLQGEPLVVVTLQKNKINSVNDLTGKEVVVNEGYTSDNYASSLKDVRVKRLPSPAESMLDLQTEKTFAYITTHNAISSFLQRMGTHQFNLYTIPDQFENTAMGISKLYPELLNNIQPILDQMERDGIIEKLKKKWQLV